MKSTRQLVFTSLTALSLVLSVACSKKPNEEAVAAQEVAKAADARVAALEQQLEELKSGKHHKKAADKVTAEHVSQAQAKAVARQLSDAKKSAETKHKSAVDLASTPPPSTPAPKPVTVEVPAGTEFSVKLSKDLTTSTVQPGDVWEGSLASTVSVGGQVIWPAGTAVRGVVTQSTPTGRLSSGQGSLGIKTTFIGQEDVDTAAYVVVGDKKGGRNAKIIGGGAALGALIGVLSDNKNKNDHALGGAAIGAAAGTAAAAATADTVIKIPADKTVAFSLAGPEKIILKH